MVKKAAGSACFRTHLQPIESDQGLLWYLAFPCLQSAFFCSPRIQIEKSLSSRILPVGGKQKEVASYKTLVRLVVAAAEEKWGFLTFLLRGASCKGALEVRALFCQSWLPSPATFLSCILFSLILEFYKRLMLWNTEKQRKGNSHTIILTADLFSHKMEL